jgi:hypothetical protein
MKKSAGRPKGIASKPLVTMSVCQGAGELLKIALMSPVQAASGNIPKILKYLLELEQLGVTPEYWQRRARINRGTAGSKKRRINK